MARKSLTWRCFAACWTALDPFFTVIFATAFTMAMSTWSVGRTYDPSSTTAIAESRSTLAKVASNVRSLSSSSSQLNLESHNLTSLSLLADRN